MNSSIQTYWQSYLSTLPADNLIHQQTEPANPFGFGDTAEMADELGALVVAGIKTATCSALWEYEADGEPIPQVGELAIVLNGTDKPLCIIETVEVRVRPYNEVDAEFAHDEGEGDRSLAYWRDAHWRFFSRVLSRIGREPTPTMPLVCERFRVVYRYKKTAARFREYNPQFDFMLIRDFLMETYAAYGRMSNWGIERWNYARYFVAPMLTGASGISLWEDMVGVWENEEGRIVGVANIEHPDLTHRGFGEAFFQRHPQYTFLLGQMLDYAEATFRNPHTNSLHIYIDQFDEELQALVKERGYQKDETQSNYDSEFVIRDFPSPALPQGFALQSMADENNIELRREVFGRAFNHPDPADWPSAYAYRELQHAPDYHPNLDLYVVGPAGNHVAFTLIWYDGRNGVASLEPVGTHPDFRGRGLGKAAVLEAIRRAAVLGASKVCVGSGQAFYEAIGFRKKYLSFLWNKQF
jgi:uncharacterized protein YhfF/predicted N-acetyltransferase YhbS